MRGLSLKQHDPLRKRKAVTAGARGGHFWFAKEAIIKGQSDYLCISADLLYPLSTFFYLFPTSNFPATLRIMSLVWNTLTKKPHSFDRYRKQDSRSLTAKRLKGCGASARKGGVLVTVRRGEQMAKGQRGHTTLQLGLKLRPTSLQKTGRGVKKSLKEARSPQSCSDISIEADEKNLVTLYLMSPLPPLPCVPLCALTPTALSPPSQHAVGIYLL